MGEGEGHPLKGKRRIEIIRTANGFILNESYNPMRHNEAWSEDKIHVYQDFAALTKALEEILTETHPQN